MIGKGTVELIKFKTTNPEEYLSILDQKFGIAGQIEPIEEFSADFSAYAVAQLFFTLEKYNKGISLEPNPGEGWLFLELPLSGQLQLSYRGRGISFDHNSTSLIASDEPIHYRYQENANHLTVGIDKQMLNAYAQKLVNGLQEREFTVHTQFLCRTPEVAIFRRYLEFISQELVRGGSFGSCP